MTTPTREQVVRWSGDAYKNSSDYWNYMTTFAALARADLEATIAEKTKELEEMAASECIAGLMPHGSKPSSLLFSGGSN